MPESSRLGAELEPTATADHLTEARAALRRHEWAESLDQFLEADRGGDLGGDDLVAMAEAAWFAGQADLSLQMKERAYKAYQGTGNRIVAAVLALELFDLYTYRGKPSISAAWMRRGAKLLEGQPESNAHGYLAVSKAFGARAAGDIEEAMRLAELAVEIGNRSGDSDLVAHAMTVLGSFRVAVGDVTGGFELLEEAAVAAVNGELSTFITGTTTCTMIAACRDLSDYQRAQEWTEAAEKWCERESVGGFPGVCRVHRAEIVALTGAWEKAEDELRRATSELHAFGAGPPMGDGFYAIAQIRLRKGDLEGAEEALRQAHGLGRNPQPTLALIRLAQGKARAALAGLSSSLGEHGWDKGSRVRLLPAYVEIAVAADELVTARQAAEELGELTAIYQLPAMAASKAEAWGRLLLAEGDAAGASRELRAAIRIWRELGAPYEVARARNVLASALRGLHDDDAADIEIESAHNEFVRLGARLDIAATEREIRLANQRKSGPSRVRKTFVFTDIVGSTSLAEALGNEAWTVLLHWHDEALRGQFNRFQGQTVNSTGDGFFVAFDTSEQALACAVAIQRELAEHRRATGFATMVRIGVHTADANRHGDDYSGVGVHVAARVAALAGGGEIITTVETLDGARDFSFSEPREEMVKGVADPIKVASITWD